VNLHNQDWEISIKNLQKKHSIKRDQIFSTVSLVMKELADELVEISAKPGVVNIAFVGEAKMAELNLQYRQKEGSTDVLSFPLWEDDISEQTDLGEVIICPAVAENQRELFGTSYDGELDRLIIHGILHLIGYDHERSKAEAKRMKTKENRLWKKVRGE